MSGEMEALRRRLMNRAEVRVSYRELNALLSEMAEGGVPIARLEAMEHRRGRGETWLETVSFIPVDAPAGSPPTIAAFLYQWSDDDYDAPKIVRHFREMIDGIGQRKRSLTYAVWADPR